MGLNFDDYDDELAAAARQDADNAMAKMAGGESGAQMAEASPPKPVVVREIKVHSIAMVESPTDENAKLGGWYIDADFLGWLRDCGVITIDESAQLRDAKLNVTSDMDSTVCSGTVQHRPQRRESVEGLTANQIRKAFGLEPMAWLAPRQGLDEPRVCNGNFVRLTAEGGLLFFRKRVPGATGCCSSGDRVFQAEGHADLVVFDDPMAERQTQFADAGKRFNKSLYDATAGIAKAAEAMGDGAAWANSVREAWDHLNMNGPYRSLKPSSDEIQPDTDGDSFSASVRQQIEETWHSLPEEQKTAMVQARLDAVRQVMDLFKSTKPPKNPLLRSLGRYQHVIVGHAMKMLREEMTENGVTSDYANGWHDNLACAAIVEGVDRDTANRIAARFMKLAFDVETKAPEDRASAIAFTPTSDNPLTPIKNGTGVGEMEH